MTKKTALFYERYELKFHISLATAKEIADFIAPYCQLDYYSEISPDNFYTINNLYLDTPDFLFLRRKIAGIDRRFNLRIRTYGEEESDAHFLEIKDKVGGFIKKKRGKVNGADWFSHLENFSYPTTDGQTVYQNDYAYDFAYKVQSYRAEPKIFTQYRRKAYFSNIDDYARVTFDKELRYEERNSYDFSRDGLNYYDVPTIFSPETNIILELKCYTRVPFWILDVIKHFNLTRSGFSKYANGVKEVMYYKSGGVSLNSRDLFF